ncbi:hypothetical protein ACHAQH_007978 [Verticillium albo-atrum]
MQGSAPGSFRALLNTKNQGKGYINDFRTILTEGYIEYLQTLCDWANNDLGIQFSTQPSARASRVSTWLLNKQSANNKEFPSVYRWTYSYLTDLNLDLPKAIVSNGLLAPEGPASKAFVLEGSQNMTVESVERIRRLAQAGLPVIIAGSPAYYPTRSACSAARYERALASLRDEANVYSVPKDQVANKLRQLGLAPRIQTSNKTYTTWRVDESVDYAFLFNDGAAPNGLTVFATNKKPFALDPWTGERTEVAHYTMGDGTIPIPLKFAADDTKVFSFEKREHSCRVESAPHGTLLVRSGDSKVILRSKEPGTVALSSGDSFIISAAAPALALDNWTLTVSHRE